MKIIVIGGNGYIGRHVVNKLLEKNIKVLKAVSQNNNLNDKSNLPFDVFNYHGNVFEAMGKPDIVINLAWRDGFSHNKLSHFDFAHAQFKLMHNLLANGLKHIVSIGTVHEVGYYVGEVTENTPTNPMNNYGIAKNYLQRVQQQLCLHYNAINQWIRCFYITGDDAYNNSVFSKILAADKIGQKKFSLTDGEVLFDFIDVKILAEMIVRVALQKDVTGIINCCSGTPVSLKTKITDFIEQNKLSIKPDWGVYTSRSYDSKAIWGDVKKFNKISCNKN